MREWIEIASMRYLQPMCNVLPRMREWIAIANADIASIETAVLPRMREWIEMCHIFCVVAALQIIKIKYVKKSLQLD